MGSKYPQNKRRDYNKMRRRNILPIHNRYKEGLSSPKKSKKSSLLTIFLIILGGVYVYVSEDSKQYNVGFSPPHEVHRVSDESVKNDESSGSSAWNPASLLVQESEEENNGTTEEETDDASTEEATDDTTKEATDDATTDDAAKDATDDVTTKEAIDDATKEATDDATTKKVSDDVTTKEAADDATEETTDDATTKEAIDDATTKEATDDASEETTDDATTKEATDDATEEATDDATTKEATDDATTKETADDTTKDATDDDNVKEANVKTAVTKSSDPTSDDTMDTDLTEKSDNDDLSLNKTNKGNNPVLKSENKTFSPLGKEDDTDSESKDSSKKESFFSKYKNKTTDTKLNNKKSTEYPVKNVTMENDILNSTFSDNDDQEDKPLESLIACLTSPFADCLSESFEEIGERVDAWFTNSTSKNSDEDANKTSSQSLEVGKDDDDGEDQETSRRMRRVRNLIGKSIGYKADMQMEADVEDTSITAQCATNSSIIPGFCGPKPSKESECFYTVVDKENTTDPIPVQLVQETSCTVNVISLCSQGNTLPRFNYSSFELDDDELSRLNIHTDTCLATASHTREKDGELERKHNDQNSLEEDQNKKKPPLMKMSHDLLYIGFDLMVNVSEKSEINYDTIFPLRLISTIDGDQEQNLYPMQIVLKSSDDIELGINTSLSQKALLEDGYIITTMTTSSIENENMKEYLTLTRYRCSVNSKYNLGGAAGFADAGIPI